MSYGPAPPVPSRATLPPGRYPPIPPNDGPMRGWQSQVPLSEIAEIIIASIVLFIVLIPVVLIMGLFP